MILAALFRAMFRAMPPRTLERQLRKGVEEARTSNQARVSQARVSRAWARQARRLQLRMLPWSYRHCPAKLPMI